MLMEVLGLILITLFVQLIVISIIAFVLLKVLNNILIEMAIEQFERLPKNYFDQDQKELMVVAARNMAKHFEGRLSQAVSKKFDRPIRIAIREDKKIRGGIMIHLKDSVIDGSLHNRLKESGLIGKFFGIR